MSGRFKEARERLPVYRAKKEILEVVARNTSVVFLGDTGCGKTTQIPQYLLEAGFAKHKCIGVTQPRRVAATSISKRVAQELGTELGQKVGYSIRFSNVTSAATKIKFLTDGMLLREAISDSLLLEYSVVILDEAHERSLHNDLLLGIVKGAQLQRARQNLLPLKIIIMSATMDSKRIGEYFNAPIYQIRGRDYSIKIFNPPQPLPNENQAALTAVFQIHQNEDPGDILVFCKGQEEIDYMVTETTLTSHLLPVGVSKIFACGLYGALPSDIQEKVFDPVAEGTRKVIFATNIAETSITIPNIKYVIDSGYVKRRSYVPSCRMDILHSDRISKAEADQRAGRAGREFDGKCYRLYTTEEFKAFEDHTKPEILRCCLSNSVLQMVALGIKRIEEFDFIDKPSEEHIATAIQMLEDLKAVTNNNGELELTETGKKMVAFPIDPRFSKIIISSQKYCCTEEILSIISLLCVESVFYTNTAERAEFNKARKKFESMDGDHMMLLNVYKQFKKSKCNPEWCKENYINIKNMRMALAIRKQLRSICTKNGINMTTSSYFPSKIIKCLAAGLFKNTAFLNEQKTFKLFENNQEVEIHPSSCLFRERKLRCCIFTELLKTSKVYIKNVSYIPEEMLLSVEPKYFKDKAHRLGKIKPGINAPTVIK